MRDRDNIFTEQEIEDLKKLVKDIKINKLLVAYADYTESLYNDPEYLRWKVILNKLEFYKNRLPKKDEDKL